MASIIIKFDPTNKPEPYMYMAKEINSNKYVVGNIVVKKPWYSRPSQHRYYIVENNYEDTNFCGGKELKGFKMIEVDQTTIEPYTQTAKIKYNQNAGLDIELVKNLNSTEPNNIIAILYPHDDLPISLWNIAIETRPLILSDAQHIKTLDKVSNFKVFDFIETMFFENKDPDYAYGIFLNNEIIGYCTIESSDEIDEATPDAKWLNNVFIREEYRDNGYATKLITYALQQHNKHNIFADVLFENLEPFYANFGFKRYEKNTPGLLILRQS